MGSVPGFAVDLSHGFGQTGESEAAAWSALVVKAWGGARGSLLQSSSSFALHTVLFGMWLFGAAFVSEQLCCLPGRSGRVGTAKQKFT